MYAAESDLNKIQYKKPKKDSLEVVKIKNQDNPIKGKPKNFGDLESNLKEVDWISLIGSMGGMAAQLGLIGTLCGGIMASASNNKSILIGAITGVVGGAILGALSYYCDWDFSDP